MPALRQATWHDRSQPLAALATVALLVVVAALPGRAVAAQPLPNASNVQIPGLSPGALDTGSGAAYAPVVPAYTPGATALPYTNVPLPYGATGVDRLPPEDAARSRSRQRGGELSPESRFQRLPVMADDGTAPTPRSSSRRTALAPPEPTPTLDGEPPASTVRVVPSALLKHGDLTVRDINLREALLMISEIWETSIVVGDQIDGTVSGVFKDAPLSEVLDALLLANGYSYRQIGSSLVVMKVDQVGDVNPMFESAAIPCGAGDAKEISDSAKLLLSPRGKALAMESSNGLLVVDYPDRVAAVRRLVADLNRTAYDPDAADSAQLQVMHYHPEYVMAVDLVDSVKTVISRDGKVHAMPEENTLILLDAAPRLALVKQLLTRIDVPRAQVRITALIYDISLEDIEKLGINWSNKAKARFDSAGNPQTTFQIDSVQYVPPSTGSVNGAVSFMNLSRNFDLTTVMQALAQCKDSRLLADPNVTVVDNGRAVMKIVTEIPYQQLTQTQQAGNIGTTAFREAGITLNVVPRLAGDGTMYLTVMPSFSRLTGFTPGTNPQPIFDKREVTAIVRVANQQTLVIGGLRQRRDIGDFNGVLGLKDVKGIGKLFRSRETTVGETELVVFIRPEIITPFDVNVPRQNAAEDLVDAMLDQVPVAAGPQPKRGFCPPGAATPEPGPPGRGESSPRAAPEEVPAPAAGASKAAKNRDGRDPSFWEKHFGSKERPQATFVDRQPLRPAFEDRFHERSAERFSADPAANRNSGPARDDRISGGAQGQTVQASSPAQAPASQSGMDAAQRSSVRRATTAKKPSMWAKLFGPKQKPAAEVADPAERIRR